jgi:hypothetical protein
MLHEPIFFFDTHTKNCVSFTIRRNIKVYIPSANIKPNNRNIKTKKARWSYETLKIKKSTAVGLNCIGLLLFQACLDDRMACFAHKLHINKVIVGQMLILTNQNTNYILGQCFFSLLYACAWSTSLLSIVYL